MIPSDHFVRFYNEAFKFLDQRNGLQPFYDSIAHHQELHCLKIFREKGLKGMYEYWEHIRIEENCDMSLKLYPDKLVMIMHKCPSLSKNVDNDAGLCLKYCNHCFGWCRPLLEKAGYVTAYNNIAPDDPRCIQTIYPKSSGKTSCLYCDPSEYEKVVNENP